MESQRKCRRCSKEKPLEKFGRLYNRGPETDGRRRVCKDCISSSRREWGKNNPEKVREYIQRGVKRRHEVALAAASLKRHGRSWAIVIDMYRRAISDEHADMSSEEERLAYCRGYIAGADRRKEEESQASEHQDLVFRIASEIAKSSGPAISYEEAVAAGYLGMMNGLRTYRSGSQASLRTWLSRKIRWSILDDRRSNGNVKSGRLSGSYPTGVNVTPAGSLHDVECGAIEPSDNVGEAIANMDLSDREGEIVVLLSNGLSKKDISERMGVSPSRISQMVRNIRKKHGEDLLRALES